MQADAGEPLAIELLRARLESHRIAVDAVAAGEGLQERNARTEVGQRRQSAIQLACGQVVQHVTADQQVCRAAWAQVFEIAETGQVQVAARTEAADRVFAAVKTQVVQFRSQLQQRRAPRSLAATDVEHAADWPLEVVLRGCHGQGDLARESGRAADRRATRRRIAVPLVEIGLVVVFAHRTRCIGVGAHARCAACHPSARTVRQGPPAA